MLVKEKEVWKCVQCLLVPCSLGNPYLLSSQHKMELPLVRNLSSAKPQSSWFYVFYIIMVHVCIYNIYVAVSLF